MSANEEVTAASNGGQEKASPETRAGARPKTSGYSTPGEGRSTAISVVTMLSIFLLWWLASHLGWMPPLFLPTPETVLQRLWESARGDLTDAPLAHLFGWSMFWLLHRVLLSCP